MQWLKIDWVVINIMAVVDELRALGPAGMPPVGHFQEESSCMLGLYGLLVFCLISRVILVALPHVAGY